MKKSQLPGLIFISLIIVSIICLLIREHVEKKDLLQHYNITSAVITDFSRGGPGHEDYLYFSYKIGAEKFDKSTVRYIKNHAGKIFVGQVFPLIYDTRNIKNYYILIFEYDFKRYGLQMPYSLRWTDEYID